MRAAAVDIGEADFIEFDVRVRLIHRRDFWFERNAGESGCLRLPELLEVAWECRRGSDLIRLESRGRHPDAEQSRILRRSDMESQHSGLIQGSLHDRLPVFERDRALLQERGAVEGQRPLERGRLAGSLCGHAYEEGDLFADFVLGIGMIGRCLDPGIGADGVGADALGWLGGR